MLLKKKTLSSVRFPKALSFGKSLKLNGIYSLTITPLTGVCCFLAHIYLFKLFPLVGNSYTFVILPWFLFVLFYLSYCFFFYFLECVMLVVVTTISFLVSLYSIPDLKKKLFAFRLKETIYGLLTQIPIIKADKPIEDHLDEDHLDEDHLDEECAALDLADSLVIVEPSYNYHLVGGFLILALALGLCLYLSKTSGHGGDTGQSPEDSPFIQDNISDSLSLAKAEVIEEIMPFYESWDTPPGDESPFIEGYNLSSSYREDSLSVSLMEKAALPSPQGLNAWSPEIQDFYVELTPKELDLILDQVSLSLSGEIAERWSDGSLTDIEYFELLSPFLSDAYTDYLELLYL